MTELTKEKPPARVSIVIPMLNEIDAITRCIESILQQDYPQNCIEIVVVDGLSTDGSRERVKELTQKHSNIRMFDNPQRRTPISLNVGIKNSQGDIVIILGAHTKIKSDFISLNVRYMREMNVPCVGGTQVNVGESYMQQVIGCAMGSPFGIPSAPYRFWNKKKFVDTVVYASYDKKLFAEVGYFDEELHISEDAEFNWRIRKAGHKIFYTPEIVSYYYPRSSIARLVKQFFNYGILRVNVIKKHFAAIKAFHLLPPLFVLLTIALALLSAASSDFTVLLVTSWTIYLIYILIASLIASMQKKKMRYFLLLPAIFISMQLSWGIGFLVGIFKTYK